jgi:hypothetical protein
LNILKRNIKLRFDNKKETLARNASQKITISI